MRPAPLLALTGSLLLGAPPALAAPPQPRPRLALRLTYTHGPGTESCPREHVVQDLLLGAFGYEAVQPDAGARIEFAVTREKRGFHLELTISDDTGKIVWVDQMDDPSSCMALLRTATVGAVVMAEIVLAPPAPPAPPPAPPVPPAPPPVQRSPPPVRAPPAPQKSLRYQIGAGPMASLWLTPGPFAMGGYGSFTAPLGDFSITGELRVIGSVGPGTEQGRYYSQVVGVSAVPCFPRLHLFGHLDGFLCGVALLGARFWSGGHVGRFRFDSLLLAAGPRVDGELLVANPFVIRGFLEAALILPQEGAKKNNHSIAWRPSLVGFSTGLSLRLSVW